MPDCLAVIPARAGSKGVPGKNVAMVGGKPLLTWTIACARTAKCVERVVVSTEDERTAAIAKKNGAEVPFLRPLALARDDTPGIDPLLHVVEWLGVNEGYFPEWIFLLQPTSPLRTSEDVDRAYALAHERSALVVVSVTETRHHPFWCQTIGETGRLSHFLNLEKSYNTRQELPKTYSPNGAIYLIQREFLLAQRSFYGGSAYPYIMPEERSLDIDTAWDLYLADLILRNQAGYE